jgi:hypothetical protein
LHQQRLEETACECYEIVRKEVDRLSGFYTCL